MRVVLQRVKEASVRRRREDLRHRPGPTPAGRRRAWRRRTRSGMAGRKDCRAEDHGRRIREDEPQCQRRRRGHPGRLSIHSSRTHAKESAPASSEQPRPRTPYVSSITSANGSARAGVHPVETGRFGAMMDVSLVNDGPVTILLESPPPVGQHPPLGLRLSARRPALPGDLSAFQLSHGQVLADMLKARACKGRSGQGAAAV